MLESSCYTRYLRKSWGNQSSFVAWKKIGMNLLQCFVNLLQNAQVFAKGIRQFFLQSVGNHIVPYSRNVDLLRQKCLVLQSAFLTHKSCNSVALPQLTNRKKTINKFFESKLMLQHRTRVLGADGDENLDTRYFSPTATSQNGSQSGSTKSGSALSVKQQAKPCSAWINCRRSVQICSSEIEERWAFANARQLIVTYTSDHREFAFYSDKMEDQSNENSFWNKTLLFSITAENNHKQESAPFFTCSWPQY